MKAPSDTLWVWPSGQMTIGKNPEDNDGRFVSFKPSKGKPAANDQVSESAGKEAGARTLAGEDERASGAASFARKTVPEPEVEAEEHATVSPILANGLGEAVGQGGFGTVHRVPGHSELVVKVVTADAGGAINAQLRREADTLKRLSDAGVPTVFEGLIKWVGNDGKERYGILMRYVDGAFSKNVLQQGKEQGKAVKPEHRALINLKTVEDLRALRERLAEGRIDLRDLQFMIDADGSIHVIDPARADFLGRGDEAKKRLNDMKGRLDAIIADVQAIAIENAAKGS